MKTRFFTIFILILSSCQSGEKRNEHPPYAQSDLVFPSLASSWDEAIPLGNGMLGALIWEKDNKLRFSLDRADLWDLRPMEGLEKPVPSGPSRLTWVPDGNFARWLVPSPTTL